MKDGRRLEGDLNDPLFRWLYLYGVYEPIVSTALSCLVRSGETVIDVGANVGLITSRLGQLVGMHGHVYAFEPIPRLFAQLQHTIELNHLSTVVKLQQSAVGDRDDQVTLFVPTNHSHACSSLRVEQPDQAEAVQCPMVRLDTALPASANPVLVKVDVEGAEQSVLTGANQICAAARAPSWIMEINRTAANRFGYEPEDLIAQLGTYGYHHYYWSDHRQLQTHPAGLRLPDNGTLYALPKWAVEDGRVLMA
jgi:FkbM family methyltransferase